MTLTYCLRHNERHLLETKSSSLPIIVVSVVTATNVPMMAGMVIEAVVPTAVAVEVIVTEVEAEVDTMPPVPAVDAAAVPPVNTQ